MRWDDATKTPYFVYRASDGWHQTWYDDGESLGDKLDLINERDIGGLGAKALGAVSIVLWLTVAIAGRWIGFS